MLRYARHALLVAAAGVFFAAPLPARAETEVDLALVIAVDISYSMDPEEQALQRDGFVGAFRSKEVHDAIRSGARIYATVAGWGVSSDGRGGLTRPEVDGQLLAVNRAYDRAGFDPGTVDLFEGHGTGTDVGDPVLVTLMSGRTSV